jgi:tetratricopeptide (TPR) repeat protein
VRAATALALALLVGCAGTPVSAPAPTAGAGPAAAAAPAIWPISPALYRTTSGATYLHNLDARIATLRERLAAQDSGADRERLAASLYQRYRLRGVLADAEGALALLEAGVASADGHVLQAAVLAGFHRFAEAEAALQRAAAAGADAAAVRRQRADLLVALGRYADLAEDFAASAMPTADFDQLAHRADLRVLLGDLVGAERQYLAAQSQYQDSNPVPLAWLHTQFGIALLRFGQTERAADFFAAAVERLPGYYLAEEHLAECEFLLGRVEAARARYRRVVADTGNPEFIAALAEVEQALGNTAEATALRTRAAAGYAALIARHGSAFAQHGAEFYLERGEPAQALQLARDNRALRADIGSELLLAETAEAAGVHAEACAALQRARASGLRPPELGALATRLEASCRTPPAAP